MLGPKLKYCLEVQGWLPGDVVISILGSFRGWSPGGFFVMLSSWPASLVTMLPLVGVVWRGYTASCTSLWDVADMHGNSACWQASSHPIVLYRPVWPGTTFQVRCKSPRKGDPFWYWPSGSLVEQSFGEEPRPHRTSLSGVRVTITFMHVLMVECNTPSVTIPANLWIFPKRFEPL
jgi:hypothetical protein